MKETTVEVVLPAVYDDLPEICNRLECLEQKAPQIIDWDTDSNLNDYVLPGTYICNNGLRTNQGDNLPITNLGEYARFGFTLVVTQATSNENGNHHQVIGQSLILTNRLGSETKHYSRSKKYVINNAANPPEVTEDLWSPWQELQGTTFLGQVTKSQLDKVIDNGIYTGVTADAELMPAGSTFTLIVINNYAVNSAVGMPAIARQVSQTFIYLPLADVSTGTIKTQNGQMLSRTGVGGEVINWGETSQIVERKISYEYYNFSSPTFIFNINTQSTRKLVVVHSERTDGIRIKADVSWLKIGETVNFEIVDTIFTDTDQITFNGKDVYNIFEWNGGGQILNAKVLHAYISITRKSITEGEMLCHCVGAFTSLGPTTITI